MSIDLTKFYKIAAGIFIVLLMGTIMSIACGGENPEPVDGESVATSSDEVNTTEVNTAESFVEVLAGQELTTELRLRLDEVLVENSELLRRLAGQIRSNELTPEAADDEYNDWLRSAATAESLTKDQLERLLLGAAGGRY